MSAISGYISTIQNAVYGEQVRTAIVNALQACYSDVENPDLQTAAFQTAIENAYEDGILDITTVTSFNDMTNQNIIYRYNGTAAGKQKGLYYYSALSNSWVLIGSEIQKVSLASQMTDVNDIYKYIGTESGMVQNSLYCHNGTAWVPIGSGVLTASTAAQMTNQDAIYKYTGNETGYITNALYYYNGTAWALVSESIELDSTLTDADKPAQAKAVGDAITELSDELDGLSEQIATESAIVLPRINIIGDLSLMTASKNSVTYPYEWTDGADIRTGWVKAKWQGDTSTALPKKNYTLTFYNDASTARKDRKASFFDLGSGSKWVIKANYIDHTHARNVCCARLWGDVVKTRTIAPQTELENAPNFGATNGYPVEMYNNGQYWGLYTLIIPKDDYMLGMDEDNPLNCALQASTNNNGDNTQNLATEFRSVSMSGWDLEFPDTKPSGIDTGFCAVIDFVLNSSDADFVANFDDYIDLTSALDYYLFGYFIGASDSLGKNLMMLTYDGGTRWICTYWDLDSTFGLYWNGSQMYSPYMRCPEDYQETNSLLWQRMEELMGDQLYDRYVELRQTALSLEHITDVFTQFCNSIGEAAYDRDVENWPYVPQASTNTLSQIIGWITARANYVDGEIYALAHETVPCTGVSFASATIAVKVGKSVGTGIVVSPSNTTDTLTVVSSNPSVVSVSSDGTTITGNALGSATITATCGSYSATASVSVVESTLPTLVWSDTAAYNIDASGNIISGDAYITEKQVFNDGAVVQFVSGGNYGYPRTAIYKGNTFVAKTERNGFDYLAFILAKRSAVFGLHPNTNAIGKPTSDNYEYKNISWIASDSYILSSTGEVAGFGGGTPAMIPAVGKNIISAEPIPVVGGATYVLSGNSCTYKCVHQYDANGNFLATIGDSNSTADVTATLLSNCAYVYIRGQAAQSYDTFTDQATISSILTFTKQ